MIQANENEEWRPVVGYEGIYEVSCSGLVRSLDRITIKPNGNKRNLKGRMMKIWSTNLKKRRCHDYPRVFLTNGKIAKTWMTHILVAKAFIPNPENKPQVNHKDGNKLNSHFTNLEWVTSGENMRHAFKLGLNKFTPYYGRNGERNGNCKLRCIDAIMIRVMFKNGYSIREMSKMFSIDRMTVSVIVNDKAWKHLPLTTSDILPFYDIRALTGTELTYQP